MISLYQYLTDLKGYSEADAEETVLRYLNGMKMPEEVKIDVQNYYKTNPGGYCK